MNDAYEQLRQAVQAWAAAGYLPETLAYGFVVNALLAGLLIGPVLGGLGTLVVVKRFAFFSEAVGHAALTGVAIGILLGEPYTGPYGSLFGYCLLFGVLLKLPAQPYRPGPGHPDRGVPLGVPGARRQPVAGAGGQDQRAYPRERAVRLGADRERP
ncbi:ABC transporter permease [Pseudomonas aeruginosa]|nr:ABC transporter permease [Pseudomonas aeruginosa]